MVSGPDLALFLDLDGTLTPLEDSPGAVGPDPVRTARLQDAICRLDGRLAVVSGRTIAKLDEVLEGAVTCLAGVHGLERRDASGRLTLATPHPALPGVADALERFAAQDSGLEVERKGLSVTLHTRRAPAYAAAALALAEREAARTGLLLQRGFDIVELRTPGASKGDALRAFMAEPPFAGATPVFVGDDLTDEHGFEAAAALGGWGVLVGDRSPSAARDRLLDVAAVAAWLDTVGLDAAA